MKPIILVSVVSITTALLLYTIAIWRNWRLKVLTSAHVVLLWFGLAADVLATQMMGMSIDGPIVWDLHTIAGYTGLLLMLLLAIVGTWARWTGKQTMLTSFHRYAIPVWLIWVASYITGVMVGMQRV
ncbi:MAG TPA: HsmA family protein [Steroidobacteraceae bacterium]|nr:HsmA family protein [Steroidobacteraceae bacterium]HRX88698.1 HsmA family protein [Steroidobacteraceae bacterium]